MSHGDLQRTVGALQIVGGIAELYYGGGSGMGGGGGYLLGSGIENVQGKKSGSFNQKGGFGADLMGSLGLGAYNPHHSNAGLIGGAAGGLLGGLGGGGSSGGYFGSLGQGDMSLGGGLTGAIGGNTGLGLLGGGSGGGGLGSLLGSFGGGAGGGAGMGNGISPSDIAAMKASGVGMEGAGGTGKGGAGGSQIGLSGLGGQGGGAQGGIGQILQNPLTQQLAGGLMGGNKKEAPQMATPPNFLAAQAPLQPGPQDAPPMPVGGPGPQYTNTQMAMPQASSQAPPLPVQPGGGDAFVAQLLQKLLGT